MSEGDNNEGFSEEALQGLKECLAHAPPPETYAAMVAPEAVDGRPMPDKRPHYWGHRERLRRRFLASEGAGHPDYEIMEMILFDAIPRIDVKPLAKTLIAQFGSFEKAISARQDALEKMPGVPPKVFYQFQLMQAVARRLTKAAVAERPAISSWSELMAFCTVLLAHREVEEFWALFLDRKNMLIADECCGRGSVDHVPVYPRMVVKRALELNASSIILLHNHPSGDPTPSDADVRMTREVDAACRTIGVALHDHVVIGAGRQVSLRRAALI